MGELYVDARHGNDHADGTAANPLKTITRALKTAKPLDRDRVLVHPGLYDEDNGETFPLRPAVPIRGLEIQPEGRMRELVEAPDGNYYRRPVICGGDTVAIPHAERFVTVLAGETAEISNLIFFTTSPTGSVGVGILCDGTSPTIHHNLFLGTGHAGVTILGRGAPVVKWNRFAPSVSGGSVLRMDWGVTAHGSGEPDIFANHFASRNGIDVTQTSRARVRWNRITCSDNGMRIQNDSTPSVIHNWILGHAHIGIVINDQPRPLIQGNQILRNGAGGPTDGGVLVYHDARPDLGGGERGGAGGNVFKNNEPWDLQNRTPHEQFACDNQWTHAGPGDIDSLDIYDNDENAMYGEVHF